MAMPSTQFSVSPGHVDIDLSHPTTVLLQVKNTGTSFIALSIRPRQYSLETLQIGKLLDSTKLREGDLTSYLMISPRLVYLQPGQSRQVRVSTRIPENLKEGTYYTHIAVYPADNSPGKDTNAAKENPGTQLNIAMAFAVAVHASYGHGNPHVEATCRISPDRHLTAYFKNTSPWMFSGSFDVYQRLKNESDQLIQSMSLFVQRESERTFLVANPVPPEARSIVIRWKNDTSSTTQEATCQNIATNS